MTERTLYEKRGRRYYPVSERETFDGIPEGWWLVRVQPGLRSSRRIVAPDTVGLEAAMFLAEEAMVEAMRKRQEVTGVSVRHVPENERAKYQRAWEAWKAIVGDVPLYFEGVSMHDVVAAGLDVLRRKP